MMRLVIGLCMGNRNFSDGIRRLRRLSKFGFSPVSEFGFTFPFQLFNLPQQRSLGAYAFLPTLIKFVKTTFPSHLRQHRSGIP
jgi:hypothetical protein